MNPARPIFYAVFKPAEEGGYCVFFPDVPGALTQGETIGEALSMAVEALSMILCDGRKGRDYKAPSSYEEILAKAEPGDLVFPVMPDERIIAANSPKKRVSVMLPGRQLSTIGGITKDIEGLDRSKFISLAIDHYVAEKYPDALEHRENMEEAGV